MAQTIALETKQYVEFHAGGRPGRRRILRGEDAYDTFAEIPEIDLTDMKSPSLQKRKALAGKVRKVCTEVGFLYASHHPVPQKVIDDTLTAVQKYFAQERDVKMENHMRQNEQFRGYEPLLDTKLDPNSRGDLKEAFVMGNDETDSKQNLPFPAKKGQNSNNWPSNNKAFRDALTTYYNHMHEFARQLLRIFALALELEEDYFDTMTDFPMANIRALHYPPQEAPTQSDIGLGAHTDYCWFTILCQDTVPGLEVLNKNGIWIPAAPIPGTFVINIADFLQLITNNRFQSTVHRVINKTGEERYSIPFFFSPNEDAELEVLPSCQVPGERYEKIQVGEYHRQRLQAARKKPEVEPKSTN